MSELADVDFYDEIAKRSAIRAKKTSSSLRKINSQVDKWDDNTWEKTPNKDLILLAKYRRGINLDISARCPLACPRCRRQDYRDLIDLNVLSKVPGHDMAIEEFDKILMHFNKILFCGQISDPTAPPKFHEFLRRCYEEDAYTTVATSASHRSKQWYKEAFEINPKAIWRIGMDGFPAESHKYRINQDGKKLWDIMLMGIEMGMSIEQQCIVFSYNEDHIDMIQENAIKHGIIFLKMYSSRWRGADDPLMPDSEKNYLKNPVTPMHNSHLLEDMDDKKPWVEEKWFKGSTLWRD